MAILDRLNHAKDRLNAYYEAEIKVLAGQSYQIGSQRMTRADLAEIREAIAGLENLVDELEALAIGKGRRKVFGVIPRDM